MTLKILSLIFLIIVGIMLAQQPGFVSTGTNSVNVGSLVVGTNGVQILSIVSSGAVVVDPPSILAGNDWTTNFPCVGARVGTPVIYGTDTSVDMLVEVLIAVNDQAQVVYHNMYSGAPIDLPSHTIKVLAINP